MFSDRTIALLVPFLVATSQASVVSPHEFFTVPPPNFPLLPSHSSFFQQIDVSRDGALDKQSSHKPSVEVMSNGYDCKAGNDWQCYQKYYQEYNYCHPQDTNCYKDCKDWGEYKDQCYHKDYDNQCYDKCHYGKDDCSKWKECPEHDYDCYKKKHGAVHPPKTKQPDNYNEDYCKPWDYNCHKKDHKEHGYECNPWKDRSCYPYYYPEPYCPVKETPKVPHNDVTIYLYSPCDGPCGTNGYSLSIWPDGDENWTGEFSFTVSFRFAWSDVEMND